MSTPIDNEKYPPSGDGAKLPGLASPSTDINQLRNVVDNLKEIVEIREGRRGSGYDQVVTWRDLYNVGLVAVQSGGNTFINRTGSGGVSGVTLLSPNLQAMMADEFDRKVKASGAYKDLSSEIGVAAAYKGAPQEVIDILTTNLSDESIKRGADIRTVETKIQQVDKSLALSVRELTAGIDSAQASVREVMYSSANRDEATSGAVTTVNARLNNFGGGGVTVEQKMTATVNRVTGLEGIYSVKVVVDNNGTPYISGFALSSTVTAGGAATSSFVVNASNFAIYRPGTTSFSPFGVDAATNTVYINGTLLINSGGTQIGSVEATATSANSTATTANATANSANSTATTANATANSANSTATTANNTANSANSTATTANNTANTANGTANTANNTANSANSTATTANNTANSANSTATTANNTANSANSAVANKLSKAGADVLTGPISLQASNTILVGTTNDGIAIGSSGIIGRKASVTTFSVAADGTAIFKGDITGASGSFSGNITGSSNIDITGTGSFNGLTSVPGGSLASIKANTGNTAKYGVYAESNASSGAGLIGISNNTSSSQANAIYGSMANSNSASIYGYNYASTGGYGIQGQANSSTSFGVLGGGNTGVSGSGIYGAGVKGLGLLSGYGLECINGFRWGFYTMSQPTGSSSDVLKGDGSWGAVSVSVTYSAVVNALGYTPLSTNGNAATASLASDSNALGGYSPSSWARIFPTNSGNANAGGAGVNLLGSTSTGIAGAYVGTSGTSNIVTWTVQTTSPSDIRLKEEIADSNVGLAFVKQLRPVSYKLKSDPKHQKGYGFIADEVEQIVGLDSSLVYFEPDWQVGEQKGFKTIHYPSYIAVLTKAIQELSFEVETLKARG